MGSNLIARALSKTILVLVSMVMAILAAEALSRVMGLQPKFGPLFPIEGMPPRTVDGVVLWSIKAPRYDGSDIQKAANDRAAFKIVGLGDSIMYGVSQPKENTYLEQLRRLLASRSKRTVAILNLAIPGYNTIQESAVYKEIDGQIKPDLVIVHFWEDDTRQNRVAGGYVFDTDDISDDGRLLVRALPLPGQLSDFLLVHSRVYDLLTQVVVAHERNAKPNDQSSDWTRACTALTDIHERIQRAGGRMIVMASPELQGASPQPNSMLSALRQYAVPRGIEVIDLSEWLRGVDAREIRMDGCHFNAAGHRLVGERLAEYLLQHDLKE
jgi:hypothetical protein